MTNAGPADLAVEISTALPWQPVVQLSDCYSPVAVTCEENDTATDC